MLNLLLIRRLNVLNTHGNRLHRYISSSVQCMVDLPWKCDIVQDRNDGRNVNRRHRGKNGRNNNNERDETHRKREYRSNITDNEDKRVLVKPRNHYEKSMFGSDLAKSEKSLHFKNRVHMEKTRHTRNKIRDRYDDIDDESRQYSNTLKKNEQKEYGMGKYTAQMMRFASNGRIDDALDVLTMLQKRKREPMDQKGTEVINVTVYNAAISILGKANRRKMAFKIYTDLRKHGFMPTERTYTALFDSCVNVPGRHPRSSLDCAREFRQSLIENSVPLPTAAINAYIKVIASHCGSKEAMEVYHQEQLEHHFEPDVVTFSTLILNVAKDAEPGAKAEAGRSILKEMERWGLRPTNTTCTALLQACFKSGDMRDAADGIVLLKEFENAEYLVPNLHTYTTALCLCTETENYAFADEIVARLESNNLFPDLAFLNAVLRLCTRAKDREGGLRTLKAIDQAGFIWDPHTYSSAVSFYSKTSMDTEAFQTYARMKRKRMYLRPSIFVSLIASAINQKDHMLILDLLSDLVQTRSEPTESILRLLQSASRLRVAPSIIQNYVNSVSSILLQVMPSERVDKWNDLCQQMSYKGKQKTTEVKYEVTADEIVHDSHIKPSEPESGVELTLLQRKALESLKELKKHGDDIEVLVSPQ